MVAPQDTTELWNPIPCYEGAYEVSNLGRVRSLDRVITWTRTGLRPLTRVALGRVLRPKISRHNEAIVLLYNGSRSSRKHRTIHSLVLLAFVGPKSSPSHAGNHKDGDRQNNRLSNLEWVTYSQNRRHFLDDLGKQSRNKHPAIPRMPRLQRPPKPTAPSIKDQPGEQWRSIAGYAGYYEVSNHGRVKSLARCLRAHASLGGVRQTHERLLRPGTGNGYLRVRLCMNNSITDCTVHVLVLHAFLGPCPPGLQGCHNDGNKLNNDASNLRWDTVKGNAADRYAHGTHLGGSRNGMAKLTDADVDTALQFLAEGMTQWDIAHLLQVSQSTISKIKLGKRQ